MDLTHGGSVRWIVGPFTVDASERVLRRDGTPVPVAPASLDLLLRLCEAGARPVSWTELARAGPGGRGDAPAVRQGVARLRRALAPEVPIPYAGGGWTLGVPPRAERAATPARVPVRAGTVDLVSRRLVGHDGRTVALPELEARLLARLARSAGTTVSREQLLADVWGAAPAAVTRAVDTAVRRLRVRVEVDASRPDHVIGARAAGYRFVPLSALRAGGGDRLRPSLVARVPRREAAELDARLQARPLVTLVGPPGVGKSSLARDWAVTHQDAYDQCWWVELAGVAGTEAACARTAHLLDAGPGEPGAAVARRLAGAGRALLVLDTVEHLPELGARVVDWLAGAPGLTVLATGRRALAVAGEAVVRVEPLPTRDGVRLFQLRCEEAGVPAGPVEDVARLVERLDGLPLAIELAAGRAELMRPAGLLARLDDPLVGLREGDGHGEAPSTLERAVARSWDLADPEDRLLLARLSFLPGVFTLTDVALVDPDAGEARVARLARQSLLAVRWTDTSTRHSMLAAVRAYAARHRDDDALLPLVAARLLARGFPGPEEVPLVEALLAWATAAPGRGAPALLGALAEATDATAEPGSLRWVPLAERVTEGDERAEVSVQAAVLLRRRGRLADAERTVEAGLATGAGGPEVRARLYAHAAYFHLRRGDSARASEDLDRAEALGRGPTSALECRHLRASLAIEEGDLLGAAARFDEALALPGASPRQSSRLLSAAVALALELGDVERARALLERAPPSRGPRDAATWSYYEGCAHMEQGRDDEALRALERVYALGATATPSQRVITAVVAAAVHIRAGRPELALPLLDPVLIEQPEAEPSRRVEGAWMRALALRDLGDPDGAARWLEVAASIDAPPSAQAILAVATRIVQGRPVADLDVPVGQYGRYLLARAARPTDTGPTRP